ncbi:MAG: hypothetical protein COA33_010040 [Fluviicola sp.]|nr:hypothetical protein [Fluviicola sp.]
MNKFYSYIAFTFSLLFFSNGYSQTYGNEWIQYNQEYYSFKISPDIAVPYSFSDESGIETGIYKIDYTTLVNSGIDPTQFASENIQIFGKEKEIPLYIVDGGDSSIDPLDYILFYTERNDGWLDSTIYVNPEDIGNPYYSIYSDTMEYFFTWNNSTNNLRFAEENSAGFASFTPSDYIFYDKWQSYHYQYQEGARISKGSSSFYNLGEGWSSAKYDGASGYTFNLGTVQVRYPYQGAGAPNILFDAMQTGESNATYTALGNHHVLWTIGAFNDTISDSIWIGYKGIKIEKQFPISLLPSSGGSNLRCQIIGDQGAATDFQSISFFKLKYPRMPIFDGENQIEFDVENNPSEANIRLDITNLSFNNPIAFVLGDVPKKINFTLNGGAYTTLISNSANGAEQHVVYQDSATIRLVNSLRPVNFNSPTPGFFTDFAAIANKESALLMITHTKLQNASNNYIAYRNSMAGGNYNVISADIDELYQQFGAGIPQHINSIRRFAHFIYNQATEKPVGLYMMGKGIKQASIGNINGGLWGTRNNPAYTQESLIPSFGEPGSDICITTGLEGTYRWSPLIPTGRISARTDTELQEYLDKVMQHETEQDSNSVYNSSTKDWQKQVLHFVGGSTGPQQTQFKYYMDNMGDILEDSLFGGNVTSIYKTNSNPLTPTTLTAITDRIANGVSLMTYFGHATASTSGFEINLDEPSNWNNSSKFPIMLVNACYNGNIYKYVNSYSEDFVQVPNYGAIAYLASVNVGYDIFLDYYSKRLYRQFSNYNYGATIAQQMKSNIETIDISGNSGLYLETTCTQMILNGDPMVRLNYHVKPEIELLAENVWFTPENPDLTVDSIEMHILLKNLGRSIVDSFSIEIRRNFPSTSTDSVYVFKLGNLHYTQEFTFKFPLQPNISLGLNSFDVMVDLPTVIEEVYDEVNNNRITTTLFLDIDGIIPVSPYKFAVVPIDSVTVHASTNNPIADYNTYRFEMDTIDFVGTASPAHRFAIISGFGGVKSVNPSEWTLTSSGISNTLVCEDSVVYFWRVSIVGDTTWRESSFQYIPNKEGWGQDHFFQFKDNGFNGLTFNRVARTKEFIPKLSELNCYVVNSLANINSSEYEINAELQDYGACTVGPTLHVAIIDPITHQSWGTRYGTENPGNNFGNANDNGACRARVEKFFLFREYDPAQIASFQNLVNNIVPNGHYILIYSPLYTRYDLWNSIDSVGMYSTFANLGSDSIFPGRPNLPFAFFVRKGDPSSVVEYVSQNSSDDFSITANLVGPIDRGSETAPLIGPTTNWGTLHWKQDPLEVTSSDSTQLIIKTYDLAGNYQTQIDTSFTLDDSILNLGSLIDANQYPFISLEAYYKDTVALTPAQIDRWHVLYSPVPEAAIDGTSQYFWSAIGDTVTEGEMMSFAVDVKNIYSVDMDSLLINYWIEDVNNVKQYISYSRQDSLRVGATLRDTITFPTIGLGGTNILWMEVNPYVNGSVFITDQPEQEHFNNLLQLPFSVRPDDENPLLDVTFNGNHILNGDIVDPNSEIYITLKDDNEFLIMDNVADTARFGIYLTDPNGLQTRIPFEDGTGNMVMQWIPANSSNKRFKIIWPAGFEKDGTYTLFVQGSDKSDNLSGDIDYRVSFEVIHESTITQMMNYPNPFSTSTRFVFTLTGSEVPDDIIIQIMTVTGRVVREITEDQLGPIQIGRNITEYAWDGTDEFGDPLANGVYLYNVRAKINGEDIKQRESGADQYFKKSFGKMYLLR